MVLRGALRPEKDAPLAALMIDTSVTYPLALDAGGWKKAGIPASKLDPVPNSSTLKQAVVPMVRMGAFEVAQVLGVTGAPMGDLEKSLDVDLDGLLGSGLLAAFRVTLVDEGRTMWLEPMPALPPQQAQPSSSEGSLFDSFGPEFDTSDADEEADETPASGKGQPAKKPAPKAEPPKAPPSGNAPPAGR